MSLARRLAQATGLVVPADALERAVRERMRHQAPGMRDAYAPVPGTPEFEALVDLVTVPESWLFRDPEVFESALRFVQRRLLEQPGRQVTVLSLPCAGGEEPYSMAIALARAGIDPAQCRIDAVDLSQAAIARARLGRFTRNAFRGPGLDFRERWFRPDGDDYLIGEAPRRYVHFSHGNLLAPAGLAPGGTRYDLVFCRNLLIYFDDAGRAAAAATLRALLRDDGLLLSGCAEAPSFCRAGFAPESLRAAYALRKASPTPPRPRALSSRPPLQMASRIASQAASPPPWQASTPPCPQPARAPREPGMAPADLVARARGLADAGRLADAELACRQALARQPALAEAWYLLGLVSEAAGQPRAAERHLRRCLYLQPDHYEALCGLALLSERRGDALDAGLLRARAARAHAREALR